MIVGVDVSLGYESSSKSTQVNLDVNIDWDSYLNKEGVRFLQLWYVKNY